MKKGYFFVKSDEFILFLRGGQSLRMLWMKKVFD